MPERTAEEIRREIADERLGLHQDFDALKAEFRSLVPFLIAGVFAVALLAFALFTGIRRIRSSSGPRGSSRARRRGSR